MQTKAQAGAQVWAGPLARQPIRPYMAAMQVFSPDMAPLPLPPGHRFPAQKYPMLRALLLKEGLIEPGLLRVSPEAHPNDLLLAHDEAYVAAVEDGHLSAADQRKIGFPWSPLLAERVKRSTGGTLAAARAALSDGVSGQLAGGTHHAHRGHGAGFCVFNDHAVTALALLQDRSVERVAIIDLDVHHGDGNASILADEERVFVFSIHAENNYPRHKPASDLDVGLPDGADDRAYLAALHEHLPAVWAFRPDLVLYQAGVDPLKEDRLGRLVLSHEGLAERDWIVMSEAKARGTPVVLTLGGGYANPIEASVAAYANTYRTARRVFAGI